MVQLSMQGVDELLRKVSPHPKLCRTQQAKQPLVGRATILRMMLQALTLEPLRHIGFAVRLALLLSSNRQWKPEDRQAATAVPEVEEGRTQWKWRLREACALWRDLGRRKRAAKIAPL